MVPKKLPFVRTQYMKLRVCASAKAKEIRLCERDGENHSVSRPRYFALSHSLRVSLLLWSLIESACH